MTENMENLQSPKGPVVAVLMPTYNGGLFLAEQLQSISNQVGVQVNLYINDDGSTDDTLGIVHEWLSNGFVYKVFKSDRIGSSAAFFKLLAEVGDEKYVAFSDQDDIWNHEKLLKGISVIENEKSEMVFSAREHVDQNGKTFGFSSPVRKPPGWRNALVENIAFGNTQLITRKAGKEVLKVGTVPVKHFDAWVYLLISAIFKVSYIDTPLIKYRVHAGNQVGVRGLFSYFRGPIGLREYYNQNCLLLSVAQGRIDHKRLLSLEKHIKVSENRNPITFLQRSNLIAYRQNSLDQILTLLILPFSGLKRK